MAEVEGPVDVTESNPDTYTSSNLSQFAWTPDPQGSEGLLYVEFQDGGQYVYVGAPRDTFLAMRERAYNPEDHEESTGEFFHRHVVDQYRRRGEDYERFEDIL